MTELGHLAYLLVIVLIIVVVIFLIVHFVLAILAIAPYALAMQTATTTAAITPHYTHTHIY